MKIIRVRSSGEARYRGLGNHASGVFRQAWVQVVAKPWFFVALELLAILVWTLFVTRKYLDLDPRMVPSGSEYPMEVQGHYIWTRFRQCGLCALWDGSTRGGHPAFVDVHGSVLHPLVAIFTLALGVINGSKIALVGAFLIAGLAQWWMANELQVGRVGRLFTAALAVVAGSLSGRMAHGVYAVVMSTASGALVIAALVAMGRRGSRRATVALGVATALAAVSGQGYIQIGLGFLLPAVLLLVPWGRPEARVVLRRLALAGVLAGLLAGLFVAPLVHFLPEFGKALDPNFPGAQPFGYVPLNLVINQPDFATKEALGMLPYPYLYLSYIGWVPVLLAVYGLGGQQPAWKRRIIWFLAISMVLIFWLASASPLRWLVKALPIRLLVSQLTAIRFSSLIAGAAVPMVLALTALGLDRLLRLSWPVLRLDYPHERQTGGLPTLNLQWLLVIPLLLSLNSARAFSSLWLGTKNVDAPDTSALAEALETPDLQWVNPPRGELHFLIPTIEQGLKLAYGAQPWHWEKRPDPEPVLEAARGGPPPGMVLYATADGIPIYQAFSGREYAALTHADQSRTVCSAHGLGGNIDVECDAAQAGLLTVKENSWAGWHVTVDGQTVSLNEGQWLAVDLSPGRHVVSFRYRPTDVLIGLLLTVFGLAAAACMWFRRDVTPRQEPGASLESLPDTSAMGSTKPDDT